MDDASDDPQYPLEDSTARSSYSWLQAFKRQLLRDGETEDDFLEAPAPSHVCFHPHIRSFEDAQVVANGLRAGIPQIVSLAEAPDQIAQRLLDFVQGVIFVINGHQTQVSSTVFLLTPSAIEIVEHDIPLEDNISLLFN